jgi:hypothetical protein
LGVDDYVNSEAGVVAAATAAAVSPRARELFRRGAVYGLAGLLKTGDVAVAAVRGAVRGAKGEVGGTSGAAAPKRTTGTTAASSGGGTRRRQSGSGTRSRGRQARARSG